jgi:hypothetical protein
LLIGEDATLRGNCPKKVKKKGSEFIATKEVIKEQPPSRNLSATARRVLQCTRSQ